MITTFSTILKLIKKGKHVKTLITNLYMLDYTLSVYLSLIYYL